MSYDPLPELLALRAIVQFLLNEKVRECQDVNAAVFEIRVGCRRFRSRTHQAKRATTHRRCLHEFEAGAEMIACPLADAVMVVVR